eukprot:COSAG02_NODE_2452_length_8826_cov_16.362668_8_plen_125_part_00
MGGQDETVINPLDSSGVRDVKTLWKSVVDPSSGRTYYVNRNTKATVWEKPADADKPWVKPEDQQLPSGWVEHFDPKRQKPYYHNTNTGETVWKRPMAYELHDMHQNHPRTSATRTNILITVSLF